MEKNEEINWPSLYKLESSRFTLSPRLFASWLQFLLFSRDQEEIPVFDLDSDLVNAVSTEMQSQIKKGGKKDGKKC